MVTIKDIEKLGFKYLYEEPRAAHVHLLWSETPPNVKKALEESQKARALVTAVEEPYPSVIVDRVRWEAKWTKRSGFHSPVRVAHGTRHYLRRGDYDIYCDVEEGDNAICEIMAPVDGMFNYRHPCFINTSVAEVKRFIDDTEAEWRVWLEESEGEGDE